MADQRQTMAESIAASPDEDDRALIREVVEQADNEYPNTANFCIAVTRALREVPDYHRIHIQGRLMSVIQRRKDAGQDVLAPSVATGGQWGQIAAGMHIIHHALDNNMALHAMALIREGLRRGLGKAFLDQVDKAGRTALAAAVKQEMGDVVRELLESGADANIRYGLSYVNVPVGLSPRWHPAASEVHNVLIQTMPNIVPAVDTGRQDGNYVDPESLPWEIRGQNLYWRHPRPLVPGSASLPHDHTVHWVANNALVPAEEPVCPGMRHSSGTEERSYFGGIISLGLGLGLNPVVVSVCGFGLGALAVASLLGLKRSNR